MRKPIVIGNWKMNMSKQEGLNFLASLKDFDNSKLDAGLAVQSLVVDSLSSHKNNILLGAQNVCYEETGAFTGENSVLLLKELNVDFCVIGHSERRQFFNETDELVNKKAQLLLNHNILPVICVGETLEQYENNLTAEVVKNQVSIACANLDIKNTVIAYEPVWAIGTGKTATSEIANNVCKLIREHLATMYSIEDANAVRIQYGGSVNENNIAEILACSDIDGALVGGASLKEDSYKQLIGY